MKKLLSIVLCLIILVSFSCTAFATEKANLILEYSGKTLKAGQTVTAKFIINNNSGFGCVVVHVGFNKNTLELKSVTKTYKPTGNYIDVHTDSLISGANQKGKYVLGYMPRPLSNGVFSDPITYNGVFAELTFVAKKDCIPEISFANNYVDFFLDDLELTNLPYNLKINKTNVATNTSSNEIKDNNVSGLVVSSGNNSVVSNITSNKNNQNISSVFTSSVEVQENESTKPTIQNNINNNQDDKKPSDNNLTLLISALVLTLILITAAFLVKKLSKKQ